MSANRHGSEIKALQEALRRTREAQQTASDPAMSAWVSANAGTGKTYVLTARVLRLLLAGTKPERILALTYTKAAAAEMSKRIFDRLGTWVTASASELTAMLVAVLDRQPTEEEARRARQLFALAIETPGGLKVQTIHGFCERLLKRFPLEAGIPPHFTILDEPTSATMLREAIDGMLVEATRHPSGRLAQALKVAIAFAVDDSFDSVLEDALRNRAWLLELSSVPEGAGGIDPIEAIYRKALGLARDADAATLDRKLAHVLDDATLRRAIGVLDASGSNDQKVAAALEEALQSSRLARRIAALREALLTKEGEPRSDKQFIAKAVRTAEPQLTDALCRARDDFARLSVERQTLIALEATLALVTLAGTVMQSYQSAKVRRAALDFDDLIVKAADMLASSGAGGSTATQWVLFKLDGGLDHILVDEAQDTSPAQWTIVQSLASEFFSDAAGRDVARTLFAVGDEKQSIYGFQGAAPEMFRAMGLEFARQARAADRAFARVPLNVSFRTTQTVLTAVDTVFADPTHLAGTSAAGDIIKHVAHRAGHAGLVEVWQTDKPEPAAPSDLWDPNAEGPSTSAVTRLATRIANTIRTWLDSGEVLASEGRPVREADILILVRRRRPFAPAMVAALKSRGIAVAGADRLTLVDQIAVQDLIVLGDFLTLPEDDLALATVLKSPLFGLDDDDLMPLAHERKGQLWTQLLAEAKAKPRYAEAAELLKRWRSEADYLPPYEFFAQLLDRDNGQMRKRMLARLGIDAADPIDEFLNQALKYDDGAPASLTGFLASLRASGTEIKRDMEQGRNEVRIMTVHGAKGLEAPIVFLPDTCSSRSGGAPGGLVSMEDTAQSVGIEKLMLWPVKTAKAAAAIEGARRALKNAEQQERNRLLYVALTRPRDRLYVCGFEGSKPPPADSWYGQIVAALTPEAKRQTCADGREGLVLADPQTAQPVAAGHAAAARADAVALPGWATAKARSEPRLTMPLAPSRLAPLETDDEGEPVHVPARKPVEPASAPSPLTSDETRFLRGTLTHALFEHLPELPAARRAAAAAAFLAVRGVALGAGVQKAIIAETLAVLGDKTFAPIFGPDSRAEVPIVADIPHPDGKSTPLRLNGQIDRLASVGDAVLIVDYKTNRLPPAELDGVPETYVLQLAAYRLALARIFPRRAVKAAILWTNSARLMPIPGPELDRAEQRLWSLDRSQIN